MPKIDDDFRNLLRPLNHDERMALEKSVLDLGKFLCKGVTWNDTIVDGHHRYEISQKYGIPLEFEEKQFDSKQEALAWISSMQSARRNMDKEEFKALRQKIAEMVGTGMSIRKIAQALSLPPANVQRQVDRHATINELAPSVRENIPEEIPTKNLARIRGLSEEDQSKALKLMRENPRKFKRVEDALGLDGFSKESWNKRISELVDLVKSNFYDQHIPTCIYLTANAKTNIHSFAEGLVASLEDAKVVACPRCARAVKPECKCCGGEMLVSLEVAKMYGGRE